MKNAFSRYAAIAAMMFVFFSCQKKVVDVDNNVVETQPAILEPHTVTINNVINGYYSAIPAHYNTTSLKYPLLVFFHGGGQFGNGASDLSAVLSQGVPKLLQNKAFPANFMSNGKNYSFVVAAPQFTRYPSNYEAETFINYAINHYRVDPARVYLVGMNMGGVVTADVGADFTKNLAAIVPISGVSDTYDNSITAKCKAVAAGKLPVWVFQNDSDVIANVDKAKKYIATINSFSPVIPPKYTQFSPAGISGNDAWTRATDTLYKENNMNIYEWMLQYTTAR